MNFEIALFSAEYQAQFPYAFPAFAFLFGAIIGSFLNVVVYRLPIMMQREWQEQAIEIIDVATKDASLLAAIRAKLPEPEGKFNLVVPNSKCPNCGSFIKPWHNIPIIGYFVIRGKCVDCDAPIGLRYPTVELVTALLTMLVVLVLGVSFTSLAACVLTWILITLALIDFDTQLLPDDITLPALWFGLLINFFSVMTPFHTAFFGAIAGYLVLWSVYQLFKLVTGKEGMGFGDFKMLAMLGAWLGIQALPVIVILSSFAGAVIGGLLIVLGRDKDNPIKFGPFLAIAGFIAMLWGDSLTAAYLNLTTP